MKAKKTEHGIELIPENAFEEDCLKHIVNKTLIAKYQDQWESKGTVIVAFQPHPWDAKPQS